MSHHGRKNADSVLVTALAGGFTVEAAAAKARLSTRTAFRRLENPDFRRHVAEVRSEMVGRACGKLADGMAKAAGTLRKLLTTGSDSVKLGAARAMLELAVRVREAEELEQRLVWLEIRLAQREHDEARSEKR
jgi:hypothetical protein